MLGSARPELGFLLRCSQWNFLGSEKAALDLPEVDWDRFVRLAHFHRLQGLVWNALSPHADRLPAAASEALAEQSRLIVANNLAMAGACAALRAAFDGRDCPVLFLKGLTVAALAYRTPMAKMGWDIDLLIDPADLALAGEVLTAQGFAVTLPASASDLKAWHGRSKESVWARRDGLHVELHTRLADNRRLIPRIDVHAPRQLVDIAPGLALPTLAPDELFAYLCVHGASSAWFRLKWIGDVAGLLSAWAPSGIEALYRRSQDLGAYRAAGQALLVADALYGSLAGTGLRRLLARDRMARRLAGSVLRRLGNVDPREPTEAWLGTAHIHLAQLGIAPGLGYAVGELGRQIADRRALRRFAGPR